MRGIWKDVLTLLTNWQISLWLRTSINSGYHLGMSICLACHTTQAEALLKEGLVEYSCWPGSSSSLSPELGGPSPLRNSATCGSSRGGPPKSSTSGHDQSEGSALVTLWAQDSGGESFGLSALHIIRSGQKFFHLQARLLKHDMPSGSGKAGWGRVPFCRIPSAAHHWGDPFLLASQQVPPTAPQTSSTTQMLAAAWLPTAAGLPTGDGAA